ncbi:MAG: 4Fe-4S dicluster domain-containing protein [Desulfobacteraceae bacterium]|nr:4Fe-4S dicluster domain-containing protein [Desulfobacteraceae bacterium]
MESKTLIIHPEKCNNCKDCETACIESHTSLTSPGLSCIRIMSENIDPVDDFFFPVACKQCENPPCLAVCPQNAIYKETDSVLIDRLKCVGCGMCVSACPFGTMKLDQKSGKSYKCDLCGGEPQCVKVCETNALEYLDFEMLKYPNMYDSASKMLCLGRAQNNCF